MARDEQSNGNGTGSSGKSGRQDSSLSARRARLRSLAKQALPPDPYSKKQEGAQADAPSLELEFLDKAEEQGGAGPQTQGQQPSAEPWLDEAMKSITQTSQDPTPQPPVSTEYPPANPNQTVAPDPHNMVAQPAPDPGFSMSEPSFGQMPPADPSYNQAPPPPDPGYGQSPPSFESFMQGPGEPPGFMQGPTEPPPGFMQTPGEPPPGFMQGGPAEPPSGFMSQDEPPPGFTQNQTESSPPSPFGMPQSDPGLNNGIINPFAFNQPPSAPTQSQNVEISYLQHTAEKDFTSGLDLDYGDIGDSDSSTGASAGAVTTPAAEPASGAPDRPEEQEINRPWEIGKTDKKENAWSVGADEETIVEAKAEPPAEEAPAEEPKAREEEPTKEAPAPSSKKKSRRKSDPEGGGGSSGGGGEADKEVESKPAEEESQAEEEPAKADSAKSKEEEDEEAPEADKTQSEPASSRKKSYDGSEDVTDKEEQRAAAAPLDVQSPVIPVELLTKSQAEALELLTSVDQALGICAMNLSALQTTGNEQTDVLRNLRETLQNQTFFELGLNLNTLMETMSAALEPMKAVGELVPAIDQLVSTMVSQQEKEKETRITPDKLVMGLADQLGAGQIDPWTFKCAYMAVYPDEHPADLLHRLVELLGTQRLSGEMFRAAYDAVQAAEPPRSGGGESVREVVVEVVKEVEVIKEVEVVKVVPDEEVVRQLDDLKRANEDLRMMLDDKDTDIGRRFEEREREMTSRLEERETELSKKLEEREAEFNELLASKEHEIQETQEMLHSRFEEFNSRYEEMVETVNQRDEELKVKDDEIARRESEITQLKAQLDELKDSFKDTVDNLQKQLSTTQKAAQEASMQAQAVSQQMPPAKPDDKPKPAGSFFDQDSSKQQASGSFMDSGPARPLFQQQMDTFNSMSKVPPGQEPQPSAFGAPPAPGATLPKPGEPPIPPGGGGGSPFGGGAPPTGPIPEPSNQAVPKPPQPSPGMAPLTGSGSYGSGVRAQVFEVIVRQALAGAPWREICAGPMSVNNISPDEVESEVKRREALLKK